MNVNLNDILIMKKQHPCGGDLRSAQPVFYAQAILVHKEIQDCGQEDQDRQRNDFRDADIRGKIIPCGRKDNIGYDPYQGKTEFAFLI